MEEDDGEVDDRDIAQKVGVKHTHSYREDEDQDEDQSRSIHSLASSFSFGSMDEELNKSLQNSSRFGRNYQTWRLQDPLMPEEEQKDVKNGLSGEEELVEDVFSPHKQSLGFLFSYLFFFRFQF